MVERRRFRGQDPRKPRDNWFLPPSSGGDDDFDRILSGLPAKFKSDFLSAKLRQDAIGGMQVGVENVGFMAVGKEISAQIDLVAGGRSRREREGAKRALIDRAMHGETNDMLDVMNATLTAFISRSPQELGELRHVGVEPVRTRDAAHNIRQLLIDLFQSLSTESNSYIAQASKPSTMAKLKTAGQALLVIKHRGELGSLPGTIWAAEETIPTVASLLASRASFWSSIFIPPEFSSSETRRVAEISRSSRSDPSQLTQEEFELLVKFHAGAVLELPPEIFDAGVPDTLKTIPSQVLIKLFEATDASEMTQMLQFLNSSLTSSDALIRNCANRTILTVFSQTDVLAMARMRWFSQVQHFLKAMLDHEPIDQELAEGVENIIINLAKTSKSGDEFIGFLTADYASMLPTAEAAISSGESAAIKPNQSFIDNLLTSELDKPFVGILIKAYRDIAEGQQGEDIFLELFDERRPLGYFLDNLRAYWQDLRQVTREEIWPSFIKARQAKIWPSERELDSLEFVGVKGEAHPAKVLGFSGIRFFTRGYTPPEVGLEFTFADTDRVLKGHLDSEGRLVDLPFDLEEAHPHIHAFLEHIAVGHFQEVVTIAEKRIKEKGEGKARPAVGEGNANQRTRVVMLPRVVTSYVTLGDYMPQTLRSDVVIKEAREREKLPHEVPQSVVPLAYAVRYQKAKEELAVSVQRGASEQVIKEYEGKVVLNFSLIPKPSDDKKNNLPPEFDLHQENGKYTETWRVKHNRPKLTPEEEANLPTTYERRYKAAPIAFTAKLSTWFTQPPGRTS